MVGMRLAMRPALTATGGATESVFPRAEALLTQLRYQRALREVGRRKDTDRYRSLMDFLLCELWDEWKTPCLKFYLSGRRPLRERIGEVERMVLDLKLVVALEAAVAAHEQRQIRTWSRYRGLVKSLVA